ncbi:MAG: B12-binding domain-containing radical SAM protein [Deltaproteobacteria bacterium]|nr:B12-binding domain-containing radical SAM protein [Deltaproteobacteria bacterium]
MTDVLLVQPPIRDFYLTAKRTIPYGLASIAAAMAGRGFSVEILDALASPKSRPAALPAEMSDVERFYARPDVSPFALFNRFRHFGSSFDTIGRKALESGAWLVGISSLFTPYAEEALATAAAIKSRHPGGTIVMGGHHATAMPEHVLASPAVSYVLRGEGEVSLPLLAESLRAQRPLADIPGIAFRRPGGGLHINPPAVMESLDRFPLPAIDLLDRRRYRRNGRGSAVVVASRGCPLRCSYCSVGGAAWLPYRLRPVPHVVAEIETAVVRHGAGFIDFEDENLSLDRGWFLDLLQEIRHRFGERTLELRAMNGLFPPTLDETVVAAMAGAGFKALNLSLGSTDTEQLRRFHRPDVRAAFDRALDLAERHALAAVGYIIVGAPHQSAEASVNDLLFLAERRVLAGVSVFYPAPGSPDFDLCRRLDLLPCSPGHMRASALPIEHTTRRIESVTLLRLGRVLNFMKHLRDLGLPNPGTSPSEASTPDPKDRTQAGRILLARFLEDGRIRGLTPDGKVYDHCIAPHLAAQFLKRLTNVALKGTL